MSYTQKIRIKDGVIVYQDHAYSQWPNLPRETDAHHFSEMVFFAQWDGQGWECEAPEFGAKGAYGNGHLYVRGKDNVEVLDASTPVTEQPAPTAVPAAVSEGEHDVMRAAFWRFIATLPIPVQDNISTSEARGESVTATAFETGYRAALKSQPAAEPFRWLIRTGHGDRYSEVAPKGDFAGRWIPLYREAQPSATEAQGEMMESSDVDVLPGYTKWMHNSSKFPHADDKRHPFDAFKAGAAWAAQGAQSSGNSGELVQGEDNARLDAEPGPWVVQSENHPMNMTKFFDVVLANGVYLEGQRFIKIDWTQVRDWRYSAARATADTGSKP